MGRSQERPFVARVACKFGEEAPCPPSFNPNFRLFLTSEIHPKLPTSLVRKSHLFIFEPALGVKDSMLRSFALMPATRMEKQPVERARLYFLLAWFHAIVLERLRYSPLGWTKGFEFGVADQTAAIDALDDWVDSIAQNRAHVAPHELPFKALRVILGQCMYGGRIDNVYDQHVIDLLLDRIFTPDSFNADFYLVGGPGMPDASTTLTVRREAPEIIT